jgi:predicted RecB family nuclease
MTYPISQIEGMTAFAASKLKKLGIRTTEALLKATGNVKRRKELAAKTGISEQQLLEWASIADYMRIPGMGNAKAGLLRAAGITTTRELAHRKPALRVVQATTKGKTPTTVAIVQPNMKPTSISLSDIRRAVWDIHATTSKGR